MRKQYLDGIRGWASLFVLFSHLGPMFLWADNRPRFLPLLTDGQFAVYIFFVLSGYVLSIRYFEKGSRSFVVELALRRYPRLTIPIAASCLLAYGMMVTGQLHNLQTGKLLNNEWLSSFYTFEPSLISLARFSLWEVYTPSSVNSYNAVLWTMHYEMLGSIIVFTLLLFLGHGKISTLATIGIGAYFWHLSSPLFAFIAGMLVAQFSASQSGSALLNHRCTRLVAWPVIISALLVVMFRHGFTTLPNYLSLMAAIILLSVNAIPQLLAFFSNRASLLLGKLSFPLYLTHLPVICVWSSWLFLWAYSSGLSNATTIAIVGVSTTVLALIVAAAFTNVEEFAIRVSRKLSDKLIGKVNSEFTHAA